MKRLSTSYKLLTSIMAGISCSFCLVRMGHRFLAEWLPMPVQWAICVCMFLTALIYGIRWASGNRGDQADASMLAFWQGIIRYTIAIDLIMIGMQGFFQLFFFVHLGALDLPFSSLSGEELTWAYFGHYSRGFVYFIGSVQILGSLLLLFRRTRLVGVFILIPVMFTIVSLNYFFDMEFAETVHAIEMLIVLLYLLFSERQKLWSFFFGQTSAIPATPLRSVLVKNLLRASAVLIPLLLLWRYGFPDKNLWLTGKYKVSHLVINQQDRKPQICTDSLPTVVYFDFGNDCVFEFNSQQRRWYGTYRLSDDNKKITVLWHYPLDVHDTLTGEIRKDGIGSPLSITGKIGKDSVLVSLVKAIKNHKS